MSTPAPRIDTLLLGCFGLLALLTGLLAGINGPLAIAAALGVTFAVVAFADLTIGLALFTLLGFVVVLPNFAGQTLSVVKLAALPLLISWLAVITREGASRRNFMAVHPAITLVMVLFLAWTAFSLIWAENGTEVLNSLFRYTLAVTLVFVAFTAVQKERDVMLITVAMVLGATSAGIYGLLQPPPPEFTGYAQIERLSGTLGNANELAAALILGIGLSGGLAAMAKTPLTRGAALGAGGICLVAIVLTGSRGGLVAMGVMLIASVIVAKGRRRVLTLVTLTIFMAGAYYFAAVASEPSRERILHLGSGTGRTDIWTVGGRMVADHPINGVGAGNFPVSSIHYLLRPGALPNDQYVVDTPKVAHNMYLEVVAELGIVGATLFFAILVFCLGCYLAALSRFRRSGEHRLGALTTAIVASLVGLLAADFFASEQYARELWLLLALGPALLAMAKRMEPDTAA